MKDVKGITLVALVVTVIVLIILAAVTINLLVGQNGILTRAEEARENWKVAEENEKDILADFEREIGSATLVSNGSWNGMVNTPKLMVGMKAVYWDGTEAKTPATENEWYNYAEKRWANAVTEDGSMWVWIPRYAYQITSGLHTSTEGEIKVKFLQGTTNKDIDNNMISTTYPSITDDAMNDYVVHPCFTNGLANGYANGEWDSDLAGIWVAKFEASHSDATNTEEGISTILKIQPDIKGWTNITIGDMYITAFNYDRSKESHLIKNSEWGAVAYLSRSSYGKTSEIAINDNSEYLMGGGDYVINIDQSTTGNVYGIYDIRGGASERVAAYVPSEPALAEVIDGNGAGLVLGATRTLATESSKYATIYSIGSIDARTNNYNVNNYMAVPKKFGDAMYETSSSAVGNSSWFSDVSLCPDVTNGFYFNRGGNSTDGSKAGACNFFGNFGGSNTNGFRIVLAK